MVAYARKEVIEDLETNWDELRRKNRRIVIIGGVNPSKEEVMVAIGHALYFGKVFICFLLVKSICIFVLKTEPYHIEVTIRSPLDPLLISVALDSMLRPVPSVLAFHDMKHIIDPKSHG